MSEPMSPFADTQLAEVRLATRQVHELLGGIHHRLHRAFGDVGVLPLITERLLALTEELASELGVTGLPDTRRPTVARLDHVGIVVRDLARAGELYGDVLGGSLVGGGSHAGLAARTAHYAFPGGGKVELLQPTGPGGIADFLERRGEGTHHFAYFLDDVAVVVDDLERREFRVVDRSLDDNGWEEAYVSPRSAQGCVVQLIGSPAGLEPEYDITLEAVLADEWQWIDHRPQRVGAQTKTSGVADV